MTDAVASPLRSFAARLAGFAASTVATVSLMVLLA